MPLIVVFISSTCICSGHNVAKLACSAKLRKEWVRPGAANKACHQNPMSLELLILVVLERGLHQIHLHRCALAHKVHGKAGMQRGAQMEH